MAETTNAGASISSDGVYRYALWRDWDVSEDLFRERQVGRVCWIMLNPSTADAEVDDPTIRRCVGYAKEWGYAGIVVVNLFAFRATLPAEMLYVDDPVGPENDDTIREVLDSTLTKIVVCGWGTSAPLDREERVMALIAESRHTARALRLTKAGAPAHPLYLPGDLLPAPYVTRPEGEKAER